MDFCFMTPYVGGYLYASAEHTAFIFCWNMEAACSSETLVITYMVSA